MLDVKATLVLAALAGSSAAAVGMWGQCGGIGHTGETVCVAGAVCTYQNDWYSQCLPAPTTSAARTSSSVRSSSSTRPTTTVRTTTSVRTSSSVRTTTSSTSGPVSTGCVRVDGQRFVLDGRTFTVCGTNAYWLAQQGNNADIDTAFADIARTGATTVRTWAFNEVTSPSGTYYQRWSGSTPTVNTGSDGLAKFDAVMAAAKKYNIKLILALTNNWADYGGMDVYVRQILNSGNHDLFYTDSRVIQAFKNYIRVWVDRYKNDCTVLAWELANEPRCRGSTGTSSGSCTTTTITNWIKDISAYIKSLDSNHLVAIGDEGFGLQGDGSYPYQYSEGVDFENNIKISTIDFGTFHLYPGPWGQSNAVAWGNAWITAHANLQKSNNKPVILEEYGVTSDHYNVYSSWVQTVISSGLAGDMYWQAGSTLSYGQTHQDGHTVYPSDPVYTLMTNHFAALKAARA